MEDNTRFDCTLPIESALCRLSCAARETGEVFESSENVIDGTPCSYENPHAICIQV